MIEYGRKGLIGILTPQANTTVEPEFSILLPPGYAFIAARMVSPKLTIEDRLRDYFASISRTLTQFTNAPVGAFAFACTGASYLQGVPNEAAKVSAIEAIARVPFLTAGRSVAEALDLLQARRIGLVSPYSPGLTAASVAYWQEHHKEVASVSVIAPGTGGDLHPIYSLSTSAGSEALAASDFRGVDAIVMLGTGMPTLGTILAYSNPEIPILSCVSALAWRALAVFEPTFYQKNAALRFFVGENWKQQYLYTMPGEK